ncbi:MAG: DUF2357 domain-containing protein [Lachnospiraceae bacterium]|nr:DUF2357 domain-containing protein [Lachnospiraceae bacterium]
MILEQEILTLTIPTRWGDIELYIEPTSDHDKLYFEDATLPGESPYHLLEGCSYHYFLNGGQFGHEYRLEQRSEIVFWRPKQRHRNEGTIKTGIYVGTLKLGVYDIDTNERVADIELEIRSVKTDYQTDYRIMLDEIAEYYTDLVLQQGSPVTQKLEIDDTLTYTTLYQKFSFVRSIVESDAFAEAVHKVILNPVRKWSEAVKEKNIVSIKRLSRQNMRQLASSSDRIPLSADLRGRLPYGLNSIPRYLTVVSKEDTVDNQENQFVKFALRSFMQFCTELRVKKNCSNPLKAEVERTIDILNSFLDNQFFRQVSMPSHMNMNSPVLQRKEGYREILQSWLLFDLAAKLAWRGGDDVYDAGKKNVAVLYEYWLFFKLLELISGFFDISQTDKENLVKMDSDGINLDIIQGRMMMIQGVHKTDSRLVNIAFYYNRTFSKVSEKEDPIHKAGSWTMSMRPDYTLSLWPGEISEIEAESQELITHIHFDAKYRVNQILLDDKNNQVTEDGDFLLEEKKQQEMGIYKRADLLKMHAYKDAIRRTSGAYVLYPGDTNKEIRGFHEIVPGLGAFAIRPGHFAEDSIYLRQFLAEVKAHLLDRASQREKLSYYDYNIHKEAKSQMVMAEMPEPIGENRGFIPDETIVLIGYVPDSKHLDWILSRRLYNYRAGDRRGSVSLDAETITAKYLLLVGPEKSYGLYLLSSDGPKILSRKELTSNKYGYPVRMNATGEVNLAYENSKADNLYLVYSIKPAEDVFNKYNWKTKNLPDYKKGFKQTIKLSDLITLHE